MKKLFWLIFLLLFVIIVMYIISSQMCIARGRFIQFDEGGREWYVRDCKNPSAIGGLFR